MKYYFMAKCRCRNVNLTGTSIHQRKLVTNLTYLYTHFIHIESMLCVLLYCCTPVGVCVCFVCVRQQYRLAWLNGGKVKREKRNNNSKILPFLNCFKQTHTLTYSLTHLEVKLNAKCKEMSQYHRLGNRKFFFWCFSFNYFFPVKRNVLHNFIALHANE